MGNIVTSTVDKAIEVLDNNVEGARGSGRGWKMDADYDTYWDHYKQDGTYSPAHFDHIKNEPDEEWDRQDLVDDEPEDFIEVRRRRKLKELRQRHRHSQNQNRNQNQRNNGEKTETATSSTRADSLSSSSSSSSSTSSAHEFSTATFSAAASSVVLSNTLTHTSGHPQRRYHRQYSQPFYLTSISNVSAPLVMTKSQTTGRSRRVASSSSYSTATEAPTTQHVMMLAGLMFLPVIVTFAFATATRKKKSSRIR